LSIGIHPRTKKVNRAWIPLAYTLYNQRYSHLTDHSADYSCKNGDVEKSYSRFLLAATRQWRSLERMKISKTRSSARIAVGVSIRGMHRYSRTPVRKSDESQLHLQLRSAAVLESISHLAAGSDRFRSGGSERARSAGIKAKRSRR